MISVCVVQINVTDMDRALDFYSNKLGFAVGSKEFYPQIVELRNDGVQFILCKAEKAAQIDYPRSAQTLLNFRVEDLASRMKELRALGVEFIHDSPQDCPVGVFAASRDPSGNVHELLEMREGA